MRRRRWKIRGGADRRLLGSHRLDRCRGLTHRLRLEQQRVALCADPVQDDPGGLDLKPEGRLALNRALGDVEHAATSATAEVMTSAAGAQLISVRFPRERDRADGALVHEGAQVSVHRRDSHSRDLRLGCSKDLLGAQWPFRASKNAVDGLSLLGSSCHVFSTTARRFGIIKNAVFLRHLVTILVWLGIALAGHEARAALRFAQEEPGAPAALAALAALNQAVTTKVEGCRSPCGLKLGLVARIRKSPKGARLVLRGPEGLHISRTLPWPHSSLVQVHEAGQMASLGVFLASMLLEAQLYEPPPPPPPKKPVPPPPPQVWTSTVVIPLVNIEVRSGTVAAVPQPTFSQLAKPRLDLGAGARWRGPSLWGPQFFAAVVAFEVRLQVAFQLPQTWALQGRPVEVRGLTAFLGYAPRLIDRGSLSWEIHAGGVVERLTVQRLDIEGSARNQVLDVGLGLGSVLRVRIWSSLFAGLDVAGFWLPTGRSVEIPLGPSAALNRLGAQFSGQISWAL